MGFTSNGYDLHFKIVKAALNRLSSFVAKPLVDIADNPVNTKALAAGQGSDVR